MNCLFSYIGVSPSGGEVASGLYLTGLPGVTLTNLNKIAGKGQDDEQDADGVFKECEKRALLSFRSAFTAEINECYHISDIDVIECLMCENKEKLAVALWYYIGAEAMIERQGSDRLNRFTTIDRKKAGDLQSFFEQRGLFELKMAVRGISVDDSDCITRCVEHNNVIVTVEPVL
jgi:hypothetical protein